MVRATTRLAIDRQRSAQHRREAYVGPSLPEPLVLGPLDRATPPSDGDPESAAELADSLTLAFLVLLDELTPDDRAVLLLHDVFGYDFDEVAAAVGRSPAACRQAASRVRRRLGERDAGSAVRSHPGADERAVLDRLLAALLTGDVTGVLDLLAPDVVELNDGGPSRRAARRPIVGADRVARLLVNLASRAPTGTSVDLVRVNELPGLVLRIDGRPDLVMSVQLDADSRIRRIWVQLNPDKLAHLT